MPQAPYLLCEGVGCMLRSRCSRFVYGENVDRHAEGYSWIPCCHDESREAYIPVAVVSNS